MTLQDLLIAQHLGAQILTTQLLAENQHKEVCGLTSDTRSLAEGGVFVAIRGTKADGHLFLDEACSKKPVAVVVQDLAQVPLSFKGAQILVKDSRLAMDALASCFYAHPSKKMFCHGVTGTNGKTSTTYLIEHILNQSQIATGVLGTINHHLGEQIFESTMTTPGPVELQKRLKEFYQSGAKAIAMEVSSHALDQFRADSVHWDVVIFTNITRDHLDYHKSMQDYFEAKQRLFNELLDNSSKQSLFSIVNAHDPASAKLKISSRARKITFGIGQGDFQAEIRRMTFRSTDLKITFENETEEFEFPMAGEHNVLNALGAMAATHCQGISLKKACQALTSFDGVPGRLEIVNISKQVHVFVDYAHTPDALENVLNTLKKIRLETKSSCRIHCLFGCGGDRDSGKRPMMGEIACRLSDFIWITSDNPRSEDPQRILNDILAGCHGIKSVKVEVDRKKAIHEALRSATPGDVLLIAGKGHENYQIIGSIKHSFSDIECVEEFFKEVLI